MKVALVVNKITEHTERNFKKIMSYIRESASNGADLVLLPEASLTGLINNDDPFHDLSLGIEVPGEITDKLVGAADRYNLHIALGFLERDGDRLFDSAVLISPSSGIVSKYRRITPGWHGKHVDPDIYGHGEEVDKVRTELGSFALLICGDLFDDDVLCQIKDLQPDCILFPFARCFDDGKHDQKRWDEKEKLEYLKRIENVGITTFMVNYLADEGLQGGGFGGSMAVSSNGEILKEYPLGKEGILYIEV